MELFVPFFPSAFVLEYHKEAEEIIEGGGYTGLGESKMSGLYGRVTLKFNSLTLACCTGESQPEYKKRDVINNKRVNGSRRTFRENKLLLFFFFFFRFFSLPSLAKDFSFFFFRFFSCPSLCVCGAQGMPRQLPVEPLTHPTQLGWKRAFVVSAITRSPFISARCPYVRLARDGWLKGSSTFRQRHEHDGENRLCQSDFVCATNIQSNFDIMRCAWNIQTPITLRGELHKRLACDSIRIENTFNRLAINWWNFISRWDDGKKTKCDENGFISSNSPKPIERENIVGELMWQECPEMIAQMGLRREKMSTTCLINLSTFLFFWRTFYFFLLLVY